MVILWNGTFVAKFANDIDTDRNRITSKSVSSIVDDSDCEDTVPGNVDDRMSSGLGAYRSSKTEPIQTDLIPCSSGRIRIRHIQMLSCSHRNFCVCSGLITVL